jgi:hypothetical protein
MAKVASTSGLLTDEIGLREPNRMLRCFFNTMGYSATGKNTS